MNKKLTLKIESKLLDDFTSMMDRKSINISSFIEGMISEELKKDGHYDFVEIGTSDFDTLIQNCSDTTKGISIEPIGYYINRLPDKDNVTKVQAAMSDVEGSIDVYYIEDSKILENNLPWWVRGSNSVNRPHPFTIKCIGEDVYNKLVTIDKVPTITWDRLVNDYNVKSIDYLKIDTEGYDHIILNAYLDICKENKNLLANKIKFECHKEVSNLIETEKLIKRFEGYHIQRLETDILLTKNKIPRIIHQTSGFKKDELPKEIVDNINRLKEMNPTFEYRYYDNDDCIKFIKINYDKKTLDLYLSINPNFGPARADLFRYLLMYKVGGVYLDIKSYTIRPLDEILLPSDEYLLSHWGGKDWASLLGYEHGEFQNWHIICVPSHPFLKKTIENVMNNISNYNPDKLSTMGGVEVEKSRVVLTTGPIPYSISILSLIKNYNLNSKDCPIREFESSGELFGISYSFLPFTGGDGEHHNLYTGYPKGEDLIIKK
jgi:FkbM family methyltransferase